MPADLDARALNWRFVVPDEPEGLLLLGVDGEALPGAIMPEPGSEELRFALRNGPFPAVVVADLGRWSRLTGDAPAALLARLADAVAPGGWLFAGMANPWYPLRPLARGSLSVGRAERSLRRGGLNCVELYLAFPDHRCPAYLVPRAGWAELETFLRRFFIPYAGTTRGRRGRALQIVLTIMHRAALHAPHRLRAALAPAACIVSGRAA